MKTAGGLALAFITAGTACSQERARLSQLFQDGFGPGPQRLPGWPEPNALEGRKIERPHIITRALQVFFFFFFHVDTTRLTRKALHSAFQPQELQSVARARKPRTQP